MSSCSSTRSSGVSSSSSPRTEARVRRADRAAAARAAAAMPTGGTGREPAGRPGLARMAGAMSTRPRTEAPPCCTAMVEERMEPIEWPTRIVGVRAEGVDAGEAAAAAAAAVAVATAAGVAPEAEGATPSSCSATAAWKASRYLYSCVGRPLSPKPSRSWATRRMGTSPSPRAESAAARGSMSVSQVSALAPKPWLRCNSSGAAAGAAGAARLHST